MASSLSARHRLSLFFPEPSVMSGALVPKTPAYPLALFPILKVHDPTLASPSVMRQILQLWGLTVRVICPWQCDLLASLLCRRLRPRAALKAQSL